MKTCSNCRKEYSSESPACPYCGAASAADGSASCPYCGGMIEPGEKFCAYCGKPVKDLTIHCTRCHAPLKKGAAFCSQCGEPAPTEQHKEEPVYSWDSLAEPVTSADEQHLAEQMASMGTTSKEKRPPAETPAVPEQPTPNPIPEAAPQVEQSSVRIIQEPIVEREEELEIPATFPEVPPEAVATESADTELAANLAVEHPNEEPLQYTAPLPGGYPSSLTPQPKDLESSSKKKKSSAGKWILLLVVILLIAAVVVVWTVVLPNMMNQAPAVPDLIPDTTSMPEIPSVPSEPDGTTNTVNPTPAAYSIKIVIPADWDEAYDFKDEIGIVTRNGQKGLVKPDGAVLLAPTYDNIMAFTEGYAVVQHMGKYGYIDKEGKVVLEPIYEKAFDVAEGFGLVEAEDGYHYVTMPNGDTETATLKEEIFEDAQPYSQNMAKVVKDGKTQFIDMSGAFVSPIYEAAGSFSDGFAPVQLEGKWGYANLAFEMVIEPTYDNAEKFQNGLAIVTLGGGQFFMNQKGEQVSPRVDHLWPITDGLATAQVGDKYGFVDGTGQQFKIEPRFVEVYAFSEGSAPVALAEGVWGYIDTDGNPIFGEQTFEHAYSFKNGIARIQKDGGYQLIDQTGNLIIDNTWPGLGAYSNKRIAFLENGKWGYLELEEIFA